MFKVPKNEIRAFKNASKQHRDFVFKVSYDLGVACDVLGNIGKELSATLQSSNLESLKSTHDYFLEQELQLNKFAPLFMENLNFNREEFIVLKSLQGKVSCLIMSIKFYVKLCFFQEGPQVDEIKSYIDETKMVLSESMSDFTLAYAIYRSMITSTNTMTEIVINQIEQ